MINILHETGEEHLPIDNLTKQELLNRITELEREAIKDNKTYTMAIQVC